LRQTANEWATAKERTVFRDDGGGRLQVTLEEKSSDNSQNAIQFILLHEFGHVVSIGERFHPDWLDDAKPGGAIEDDLFYPLSWRKTKDASDVSLFEDVFPERREVRFYGEARLKSSQMAEVYRHLAKTNFVSLYAATGPFEDFAESFALYVHSRLMKKPYRVEITQGGREVFTYESCWDQPRCAAKQAVLDRWFSRFSRP
ncbi:MAG TPA: putative zinc-binding metallopeptidase, partial [Smithellaceae bacterium]|nr:putative zinc-binding metallopeptidase [Smithellaceae bacterium]HQH06133.1 putative zinc-binding metallopeptidase [Smithellaceae bacterium]